MALLPEEQRTAIILKEYHGLTFQEIADLLDCPLSTVKTRLYQGLTVLRRQLQQADTGPLQRAEVPSPRCSRASRATVETSQEPRTKNPEPICATTNFFSDISTTSFRHRSARPSRASGVMRRVS